MDQRRVVGVDEKIWIRLKHKGVGSTIAENKSKETSTNKTTRQLVNPSTLQPMTTWLRRLLFKPVQWGSKKFASRPDKARIFDSLDVLLSATKEDGNKKGWVVPFDIEKDKFIIFSDQHKGRKNGADDFMSCEPNYLAALDYYNLHDYNLVVLGDCEELWENLLFQVLDRYANVFDKYKQFVAKNKFYKIMGNHDLDWTNDPLTQLQIGSIFGRDITVYEAVLLQTTIEGEPLEIFCTHGHQGDRASDGNWFSKFFVSKIWAPLQALSGINPNTPAYDAQLKTLHNALMYEWSARHESLFLITGHTHQPVFESLTHIERLYRQLLFARKMQDGSMCRTLEGEIQMRKFQFTHISEEFLNLKPCYFNAGCCCFNDGDITGIEIEGKCIRLIKWKTSEGKPQRMVLEEASFEELVRDGKENHARKK
jgi:UDP-2,3-diacylglucosamine pyrophosphatase LpxH